MPHRPEPISRSGWRWLRARFGRFAAAVLCAAQVLCIALSIQVSGLAHFAADVVDRVTCPADCDHKRGGDDGDDECPPGCPTCHSCAHAQVPYARKSPRVLVAPMVFVADRDPADTTAPQPRPLPGVFRPPRTNRFVHA